MGKMALGLVAATAACLMTSPAVAGSDIEIHPIIVGAPPADGFGAGHGRRGGDGGVWVNAGEWARYNNPAFQSGSYNDWWHDRPDRAYPAWMRNNQDCAKQWYAGSTLRC